MTLRVLLLWLYALMFIVFGVGFYFLPDLFAPLFLGVPAPDGDLLIDMRATYGGLSTAVGLFVAYCAIYREYLYQGLLLAFLAAVGLLAGRCIGLAVGTGSSAGQSMFISLGVEIVLTLVFGWLAIVRTPSAPARQAC